MAQAPANIDREVSGQRDTANGGAAETSEFEKEIANLKDKFKAGAIPQAEDYGSFLSLIEAIGKAVGLSSDTKTPKPGAGLVLDANNSLSVGASETIKSEPGKVEVLYQHGYGLSADGDGGLFVKYGKELGYVPGQDYSEDKTAIRVICGPGIKKDGGHVAVKLLDKASGLNVDDGLAISTGDGLSIDDDKINVKLKNELLLKDSEGVYINYGRGLKKEGSLKVDPSEVGPDIVSYIQGDGLKIDNEKLSVSVGDGLLIDNHIVNIKLKDKLLFKDSDGITINYGRGLKKEGQLKVDPVEVGPDILPHIKGDGLIINNGKLSVDMENILNYVSKNITESTIMNKLSTYTHLLWKSDVDAPIGWTSIKNAAFQKLLVTAKAPDGAHVEYSVVTKN